MLEIDKDVCVCVCVCVRVCACALPGTKYLNAEAGNVLEYSGWITAECIVHRRRTSRPFANKSHRIELTSAGDIPAKGGYRTLPQPAPTRAQPSACLVPGFPRGMHSGCVLPQIHGLCVPQPEIYIYIYINILYIRH